MAPCLVSELLLFTVILTFGPDKGQKRAVYLRPSGLIAMLGLSGDSFPCHCKPHHFLGLVGWRMAAKGEQACGAFWPVLLHLAP